MTITLAYELRGVASRVFYNLLITAYEVGAPVHEANRYTLF
jgi:hypothetical protein